MSPVPVLSPPYLCLVTDRRACPEGSLEAVVASAVRGGVNMAQLREKDLAGGALFELARRLREAVGSKALLVINERVDVAVACGADGVQLGEEALPVPAARRLAGPDLLVGRSVHSLDGALQAEAEGADFLVVGTVFPTGSHSEGAPAGAGLLAQIARRASIPFLGIGGITARNVAQVIEAGASGAAVISAIMAAQDPERAASDLREGIESAWRRPEVVGRRPRRD